VTIRAEGFTSQILKAVVTENNVSILNVDLYLRL
jgi:hypothetical protein